jgi:uncharacterized protein YjbI with pentapeptide repeats
MTGQHADAVVESIRRGENLQHADLRNTRLHHLELTGALLEQARIDHAHLSSVVFRDANLRGASLAGATLEEVQFIDSDLTRADLSRVSGRRVRCSGCRLDGANLVDSDLRGIEFDRCTLDGAMLTGASMPASRWTGTSLARAHAGSTTLELASWTDVDASGTALTHSDLSRTTLTRVELAATDLSGTTLSFARLRDTTLQGAQLSRATLWWLSGPDPRAMRDLRAAGAWGVGMSEITAVGRWLGRGLQRARVGLGAAVLAAGRFVRPRKWQVAAVGLLLALAWVVWTGGRMAASVLADRLRYNSGIPVSTPQFERLDDRSFAFVDRGFIHVLRWDGEGFTLTRRYRIEYDEEKNEFFLENRVPSGASRP